MELFKRNWSWRGHFLYPRTICHIVWRTNSGNNNTFIVMVLGELRREAVEQTWNSRQNLKAWRDCRVFIMLALHGIFL